MAPEAAARKGKRKSAQTEDGAIQSQQEPPRKKSGRPPKAAGTSATPKATTKKPPRESRIPQSPRDASPEAEQVQYQHLKAVSRRVPRHVIDATWEPLPSTAVDRVTKILNNVERSVVMRLQDERKRTQASTAIQTVLRKLSRKMARGLPFPPGTRAQREEDFDFEKILDSTRAQEAQLTPALHSIELLKAEIRKEEALLERETAALEQLERNAKAERARRRAEAKKLHPSLQKNGGEDKDSDGALNLAELKTPVDILDDEKIDDDLRPIVEELQNHLDSMQNNFKQVEGILPAIDETEASIRAALLKHVDPQRYEQVILG